MVPSEGAIHDLLTLAGAPVDLRQQGVGRVSPEEPCIGPEVFERGAADRAGDPPALHPTPQPRAAGDHICGMPMYTRPADLRRLPDPYQSAAHSSTARLRHVAHQMRRAAQNVGKQRCVAARQAQVEVANRCDLDVVMPQEAPAAHSDKGSVPIDP